MIPKSKNGNSDFRRCEFESHSVVSRQRQPNEAVCKFLVRRTRRNQFQVVDEVTAAAYINSMQNWINNGIGTTVTDANGNTMAVTGCNQVQFESSLKARPTTNVADRTPQKTGGRR